MKAEGYEFGFWRTIGGEDLRVNEMSDDHLKNAIAMLERKLAGDLELEYLGLRFKFSGPLLTPRRNNKLNELRAEKQRRADLRMLRDKVEKLQATLATSQAEFSKAVQQAYDARNDAMTLASKVRAFQQASMIEHDDVTPEMLRQWVQDLGDDYAKLKNQACLSG